MQRIQHYAKCNDMYRYRCQCGTRTSLKKTLQHYCPATISIGTYTRIVFNYFANGANAERLIEKVLVNHDEELSLSCAYRILSSLRESIALCVKAD